MTWYAWEPPLGGPPRDDLFGLPPDLADEGRVVFLSFNAAVLLLVPEDILRHLLVIGAAAQGLLPVFHQQPDDLGVVLQGKDLPNGVQRDVQLAAGGDDVQLPQIAQGIIAVAVLRVHMVGAQQADLVVKVEGVFGEAGGPADFADAVITLFQGKRSFLRAGFRRFDGKQPLILAEKKEPFVIQ